MNAVVLDESKQAILDQQLAGGPFAGSNLKMMLFDTLTAIDHTDVLADYTAHEMAFSGYSRQTVSGWSASIMTVDFHARSQGDTVTFHNGSGSTTGTITGWAYVDTAAGKVVAAGLYTTPFTILDGDDYLSTPFALYTGELLLEP